MQVALLTLRRRRIRGWIRRKKHTEIGLVVRDRHECAGCAEKGTKPTEGGGENERVSVFYKENEELLEIDTFDIEEEEDSGVFFHLRLGLAFGRFSAVRSQRVGQAKTKGKAELKNEIIARGRTGERERGTHFRAKFGQHSIKSKRKTRTTDVDGSERAFDGCRHHIQ